MRSRVSDEFISNRAWLRNVVGGKNLILCETSALEYLELFDGYLGETEINVYSQNNGQYENINYHIVNDFDNIDYTKDGDVLCCTFNQVVNDMLSNDNSDDQALIEALSNYYFSHNNSFATLLIKHENLKRFDDLKKSAMEFYNGG